jgi:Omp85 superfamily domain
MLWVLVAGGVALGVAQAPADGSSEPDAEDSRAKDSRAEDSGAENDGRGGGDVSGVSTDIEGRPTWDKRGFDAIGLPLVSYNSDLGWGLGVVGGGYLYSPGYEPYRHALAVQAFLTTEGVQNHWLRYDGPRLFGRTRLEVRGEYRRELFAPFYGAGNIAGGDADIRTNVERWSFDHFYPGAWVRLRAQPYGEEHPLEVYAGYGFHHIRVRPHRDSALAELSPLGIQGGSHAQVFIGAIWDTRDDEVDPTTGGTEEIALRISAVPTPSRYEYAGFTLSERRFWSLGTERLIFAQRVIIDVLTRGAPFFEWPQLGGTTGGEGIGGVSSVRGVPRNRYQGTVKIVLNSEMRFYVWDFPLFGERVKTGAVAYFDVGRVWQPGVDDGHLLTWHPGIGTGIRLVRRAAVARFDYAVSTETWRPGIYVTFGHMF